MCSVLPPPPPLLQDTQVEVVLMVFRRLAEDLHLFPGGLTTPRKRDMTTALRHHVTHIFQFLLQNLEVQTGSIIIPVCPSLQSLSLPVYQVQLD